ncbi:hypothetical protein IKF02_02440 [Candidatus Saccharibacteria bacterium]|nr:hypothetical protein [Candidatus Saccharibacteria bacterium]
MNLRKFLGGMIKSTLRHCLW